MAAIREFLSNGATDGCMCLPMLRPLYEMGSKKLEAIQFPWQTDAKPAEPALGDVAHGPDSAPEAATDDEDAVSTESLPVLVKVSSGEASPTAASIGFKEEKGSSVAAPPAHKTDDGDGAKLVAAPPAELAADGDNSEKGDVPELTSPTRLTPSVGIGADGYPGAESPEVTSPHVEDSLDDKWFKPDDDVKAAYDAYASGATAAPLEISPIEAVESGEDGAQTEVAPAVVPVTPQMVSDADKKLVQEAFSAGNTGSSPMDGFRENTQADFKFTESTHPLPKCSEEAAALKETLRTTIAGADQQDKEAKKPHKEKKEKKEKKQKKHSRPGDDAAAGSALLQDAEVRPADGFFSIFTCRPQKACSVMREKKPKKEKKAKKEKRDKSMEKHGQAS